MKVERACGALVPWWILAGVVLGLGPDPVRARPPISTTAPVPIPVEWSLYESDCTSPPPDAEEIQCGRHGIFYVGPDTQSSCPAIVAGNELPKPYSSPGLNRLETITPTPRLQNVKLQIGGGGTPGGQGGGGGEPPPIPCDEGSCFVAPNAEDPWIAVLDWDTWHGWTTGWAASWMAELPVALYPLDGADLEDYLGGAVGDAHLLARLCEIAEAVDEEGIRPPAAINMSFGRLFEDDASDSLTCDPETLSCQVGQVIDLLVRHGSVAVAAAGNHGSPQFPAAFETVLSAGSMDLKRFATHLEVTGAWESPAEADTFLPGNGVCLAYRDPGGADRLWPAPPGSSYASALFSGWLSQVLIAHPVAEPLSIAWRMTWSGPDQCFHLSNSVPQRCNDQVTAVLLGILDLGPGCWTGALQEPSVSVVAGAASPRRGVLDNIPSFVEWIHDRHRPDPSSDPCVPCATGGVESSFSETAWSATAFKNGSLPEGQLVLDLSASSPLRPFLYYDALFLRDGLDFHPLLESTSPDDLPALETLSLAEAASLVIQNGGLSIEPNQQPSLVFVACRDPGDCFWNSIPVLF